MELDDIFKLWDKARSSGRSKFQLKPLEVIKDDDPAYEKAVKELTNRRIQLGLSTEDIANALGLNRATVGTIETFRGVDLGRKPNWLYIYALSYLFSAYDEHLLMQKGLVFNSRYKQ